MLFMLKEFLNSLEKDNIFSGYQLEAVPWPHSNVVFKLKDISLDKPSIYVKEFSLDLEDLSRASTECHATNLLRELTTVPVAKTLLVKPNGLDKVLLVQEELPGVPLSKILSDLDTSTTDLVIGHLVDILMQIHNIKPKKFGNLGHDRDGFDSWRECFTVDVIEKLDYLTDAGQLSEDQRTFFIDKLKSKLLDTKELPTFIHGDFQPSNLLFDPDTLDITGLLDFELSHSWIVDWELTRIAAVSFTDKPELLEMFIKRYCEKTGRNLAGTLNSIDYYRSFESLYYWVWGWKHSVDIHNDISIDIENVTGIHFNSTTLPG